MRRTRLNAAVPALILLGVLAVACAALFSIRHFRVIAVRNSNALELLAEIRAEANQHNAQEWQAIAEGKIDATSFRELDDVKAALGEQFQRLAALKRPSDARAISDAFEAYSSAVALEFRYLAAGRNDDAERVDNEQVDPSFDLLGNLTAKASASARAEKAAALRDQTVASWVIGSLAVLLIATLLAAFYRMRQQETIHRLRRAALEGQVEATAHLASTREHEANHDPLTGLPNRRYFLRRLEEEVARIADEGGRLAVMLIDLNRFKDVNDTLGHRAGDEILTQVGPRLRAALRDGDVLARLGGDEFALLVAGGEDVTPDIAVTLADRVHSVLEGSFLVDGLPLAISASLGIALGPDHGSEAEVLLQRADVAMYLAKGNGLGSILYQPESDPHSRDQLQLAGELRDALSGGQIILHYQPKVDLVSGDVLGVEALARWEHPHRGLLPPGVFLPVVERSGMMRQLTSRVLDLALAQTGSWRREGFELRVAVNLSVADLLDDTLPDEISGLLARHGVSGSCLQLEVTENVFMTAPERVAQIIARLEHSGVTLSLDDFGAGYSSLAHLRRLCVDELKIDRSFVTNIVTDAFDSAVVRSTVGLGHSLGLRVVGEGVESEEAMDELRDQGCDEAQGYFIRRPGPADELTPWLRARLSQQLRVS